MFPSNTSGIVSDQGLKGTCAVCNEPLNVLEVLPGFPLGKSNKCKTCNQTVCSKHFSASRQTCVKCETGKDSWCTTPIS
jgi:hypothetical protein